MRKTAIPIGLIKGISPTEKFSFKCKNRACRAGSNDISSPSLIFELFRDLQNTPSRISANQVFAEDRYEIRLVGKHLHLALLAIRCTCYRQIHEIHILGGFI